MTFAGISEKVRSLSCCRQFIAEKGLLNRGCLLTHLLALHFVGFSVTFITSAVLILLFY